MFLFLMVGFGSQIKFTEALANSIDIENQAMWNAFDFFSVLHLREEVLSINIDTYFPFARI